MVRPARDKRVESGPAGLWEEQQRPAQTADPAAEESAQLTGGLPRWSSRSVSNITPVSYHLLHNAVGALAATQTSTLPSASTHGLLVGWQSVPAASRTEALWLLEWTANRHTGRWLLCKAHGPWQCPSRKTSASAQRTLGQGEGGHVRMECIKEKVKMQATLAWGHYIPGSVRQIRLASKSVTHMETTSRMI